MSPEELYLFDLNGFLLVRNMLDEAHLVEMRRVVDEIEPHVVENVNKPPYHYGWAHIRYHNDPQYRYLSYRLQNGGDQYIVDDFINISPVFDYVVGHERTMKYVADFVCGPVCLRSMELRYRYPGNSTPTHMGGQIDLRNRYVFHGRVIRDTELGLTYRNIDLSVIRVVYALHDISMRDGPLCMVPGSHKGNLSSPFGTQPELEPYMLGIEMKAGDAVFFTENTRHGGLPVTGSKTRKTIHLAYYPVWAGSMSPAHFYSSPNLPDETISRLPDPKRLLFVGSNNLKMNFPVPKVPHNT